jgi:RNA polymerase sigma factor (sigma-70 family)
MTSELAEGYSQPEPNMGHLTAVASVEHDALTTLDTAPMGLNQHQRELLESLDESYFPYNRDEVLDQLTYRDGQAVLASLGIALITDKARDRQATEIRALLTVLLYAAEERDDPKSTAAAQKFMSRARKLSGASIQAALRSNDIDVKMAFPTVQETYDATTLPVDEKLGEETHHTHMALAQVSLALTVATESPQLTDKIIPEPGVSTETEPVALRPVTSPRRKPASRAKKTAEPTKEPANGHNEEVVASDDDDDEPIASSLDGKVISADPVREYLKEIGRTPLLTAEQEVELSQWIEAGLYAADKLENDTDLTDDERAELESVVAIGERSKDHMIEANLRLTVNLAKRYTGRGIPFLDLIQEGNLGLIRAVEKFDYAKGYKFSTYATWWIRQAIQRGSSELGKTIRLPVHKVEEINKLARTERAYIQEYGREATPEELADILDTTTDNILDLHKISRDPISLSMPIGDNGETEFGDLVEDADAPNPVNAALTHLDVAALHEYLDTLGDRHARVIKERYGLIDGKPKTLDEIGKIFNLTRERIRQLEKEAMSKLRHPAYLSRSRLSR